ncbi:MULTISPECIES: curli production assembly/transport component CsgF [Flavobacterium]|jgi:curli production assembly/transport component CsgF|uniref:curli production assembly/transport component CsgF n=1 Tax=Flavobacterium TaxID=237 RepID=UPI00095AF4E7|nr:MULTISPECIES: curli production assembly/transport component CsgF [Flavobacterium]MDQ7962178.1 curli assembly protein CsgF [Flavobacterium lindanitolerans]OJX54287.1 MAG: curli assembly protein CsgF [Flavobacterium sp. 38-13]
MKALATAIIILLAYAANAQDLVYKPRNPNFGGDTFNYQWLLSSAEAQNKLKDNTVTTKTKTELESFTENLNSQLLNLVSRSLFTQQFGNNGISEGSYTFGSLSVEIFPSENGLTVTILDTNTGEQTQVIIPKS